jgi:hypothetical protein
MWRCCSCTRGAEIPSNAEASPSQSVLDSRSDDPSTQRPRTAIDPHARRSAAFLLGPTALRAPWCSTHIGPVQSAARAESGGGTEAPRRTEPPRSAESLWTTESPRSAESAWRAESIEWAKPFGCK